MSSQVAVTIVAEIKPGAMNDLMMLLRDMGENAAGNDLVPFGRFQQVHFARFVVLDEAADVTGNRIAPSLVFLSDIDGPPQRYLAELVDTCAQGIDAIYSHCAGYPAAPAITRRDRLTYLRAHMVKEAAFYVNTIGRTAKQVRQEVWLRDAIEGFLDAWTGRSSAGPAAVRSAIRAFIRDEPSLAWVRRPVPPPGLTRQLREKLRLIGVPLGLLVLSPLVLLGLPVWLLLLRVHERRDVPSDERPDPVRIRELAALEDHVVQNQFSAVGLVKPGWFRRLTASTVLWLVNWGVRHLYSRGNLAGVRTIHFARWVFVDEKRRLLFASNYDGSLESYMDDFIDKLSWGLNAVFSNGVGYPRTNWLLRDGARDEQAFKRFIRTHQIPTQVWYSAYDSLTAVNIENNARIRAGLYGRMSESQVRAWLRRL